MLIVTETSPAASNARLGAGHSFSPYFPRPEVITVTIRDINPAPRLQMTPLIVGGVPTLRLEGELDQWTAKSAHWSIAVGEACTETATDAFLLDLRRLYFMDLDGLASLAKLANMLEANGRRLLIAGVRPRIREFLRNNASFSLAEECLSFEEALVHAQATAPRDFLPEAAAPAAVSLAVAA
jgi:anti-anti-sigma factor